MFVKLRIALKLLLTNQFQKSVDMTIWKIVKFTYYFKMTGEDENCAYCFYHWICLSQLCAWIFTISVLEGKWVCSHIVTVYRNLWLTGKHCTGALCPHIAFSSEHSRQVQTTLKAALKTFGLRSHFFLLLVLLYCELMLLQQ